MGETSKGEVNLGEEAIRKPNESTARAHVAIRENARTSDGCNLYHPPYCTRAIENNETMRRS